MSKEEISWINVTIIALVFIIGTVFGVCIGIYTTIDKLAEAGGKVFSNSNINIEIDLNETELVSEFNRTIVPYIIEESKKEQEH